MSSFADEVQDTLGPTLSDKGFVLDQIYDGADSGGCALSVVYYRGADTKVQIYNSSREGEVNCMIAPISAQNKFGLQETSPRWQFITRFRHRPDGSLSDIARKARAEHDSYENPLLWVKSRIEANFDFARSLILITGRTGALVEDLPRIRHDQTGLTGRIAVVLADIPTNDAGVPVNLLSDAEPVVVLDDTPNPTLTLRVHPIGDPQAVVYVDHSQLALAPTLSRGTETR